MSPVLMAHQASLQHCYEDELGKGRAPKGDVLAHLTVRPDGSVAAASIEQTTVGSPALESCVVRQIRSWRFPSRAVLSDAHFPIHFEDGVLLPGLSKEEIVSVIWAHKAAIQYCYEKELPSKPTLSGKVIMHFKVLPDGSVAEASVGETTLGSPAAESCMARQIRNWKFPSRGITSIVSFPFFFKGPSESPEVAAAPRVPLVPPDVPRVSLAPDDILRLSAMPSPMPKPLLVSEVLGVVRAHAPSVQQLCYEKESRSLSGVVLVHFVILLDGSVGPAEVAFSTLPAPAVQACIIHELRTWKFPSHPLRSVVDQAFFVTGGRN